MPKQIRPAFDGPNHADSRESYAFYLGEGSGIRFEHLARFCQPLLELFDVEPHHWRLPEQVPDDVQLLDAYTSALAAAEMFWSYFTLDERTRKRFLPELKSYFIGPEPAPHEEADFLLLVDCMRVEWVKLLGDIDTAECPGPLSRLSDDIDVPDLETLALFGEPLMDDPDVFADPDALDEVMTRVNEYWLLASAPPADRDAMLDQLVDKYASSAADRDTIRQEAERMVRRYNELFLP